MRKHVKVKRRHRAGRGQTARSGHATMATFPGTGNPLGIKVELLSIVSAGVWTDISQYVLLRNPVQITGDGPDRLDVDAAGRHADPDPAERRPVHARSSPLAPTSRTSPATRRSACRVNATSVTAVAYSGFRFWGEVSEWPPQWDARRPGRLRRHHRVGDLAAHVAAARPPSGQRVHPVQRDHPDRDQPAPRLLADGRRHRLRAARLVRLRGGHRERGPVVHHRAAGLSLAACTDFKGSDGIPQLNAAKITATVPAGGTAHEQRDPVPDLRARQRGLAPAAPPTGTSSRSTARAPSPSSRCTSTRREPC